MYYYDLFMQGPSVYIPVLLFSLIITMLAYGAFPLIFSRVRKNQITKKKFTLLCYGINLLVMIAFIAFGSKSSGGPYVLWTWIFSTAGIRKLDKRGVFNIQHRDFLNADEEEKDGIVLNADNETSRVEQKNTLANNKRNLVMDIINLVVLILVLILSIIGTEGDFWYEEECGLIFLFWTGSLVLQIINIIKSKNNIVITAIMLCSLFLMMGMYTACSTLFDDLVITVIMFCLFYLLIFELCQLFVKVILQKYHATQAYKIKCYKKIEQISTYREKGIITEVEYEKAREQIMSKIRY